MVKNYKIMTLLIPSFQNLLIVCYNEETHEFSLILNATCMPTCRMCNPNCPSRFHICMEGSNGRCVRIAFFFNSIRE